MENLTKNEILILLIGYTLSIDNKQKGFDYIINNVIKNYNDEVNENIFYELFRHNYVINTGFSEYVNNYLSVIH